MNIEKYNNFMLAVDNDKLLNKADGVLGINLYIAVGLPYYDSNSAANLFFVTKNWVLENMNKIINVSTSNGTIYPLKNIKGTKNRVPVLPDLSRFIKTNLMNHGPYTGIYKIHTTLNEFNAIMNIEMPNIAKDWFYRITDGCLGSKDNFKSGNSGLGKIVNIMFPQQVVKLESKGMNDYELLKGIGKLIKVEKERALLKKLYALSYLKYDINDCPMLPNLDVVYDRVLQAAFNHNIKVHTVRISIITADNNNYALNVITSIPNQIKKSIDNGEWNSKGHMVICDNFGK